MLIQMSPPVRLLLILFTTIIAPTTSNAFNTVITATTGTDISAEMPLEHLRPAACQPTTAAKTLVAMSMTAAAPTPEMRAIATSTMDNALESCSRQTALAPTANIASFIAPAAAIRTPTPDLLEKLIDVTAAVAIMVSEAALSLASWSSRMDLSAALLQNIPEISLITTTTAYPAKPEVFPKKYLMMDTAAAEPTATTEADDSRCSIVYQEMVINYWVKSYIYKYILQTQFLFPKVTMDTLYPSDILNIKILFY